MKTSKLVVTTTLGIAIAFGTSIDSADAQTVRRRTANTYSPTATNEQSVISQFTLVDITADGTLIVDRDENQNVGLFVGAIENFAEASGTICQGAGGPGCADGLDTSPFGPERGTGYIYDSSGFPIFFDSDPLTPETHPINGNLLVERFDADRRDPLFPTSTDVTIGYTILEQGSNEPAYTFRLQPTEYSDIPDFDLNQAINSLSYISEQNLLVRTKPVLFYTDTNVNDEDSTLYRYRTDLDTFTPEITFGNVPLQNREVSTPVPEPSSILGTLAALCAGALIKRTKQH